jgi:hypothetical protein
MWVNDSETLPFNQYFGMGLTGFGLVPHRPIDSMGVGMSWAWLYPNIFNRSSELMFQSYFQADLFGSRFFLTRSPLHSNTRCGFEPRGCMGSYVPAEGFFLILRLRVPGAFPQRR